MALSHTLPARKLQLTTTLQAVGARVNIGRREVTVCSIYLPPGRDMPVAQLEALMSELPPPLLLLGDFNAHHTVWGCDQVNTRGRHLERFISQHALCVLNTGQATHFSLPSGRESVLDLSLCSPQHASLFHWSVGGDPMGSDHLPIFLAIDDQSCSSQNFSPRFCDTAIADNPKSIAEFIVKFMKFRVRDRELFLP